MLKGSGFSIFLSADTTRVLCTWLICILSFINSFSILGQSPRIMENAVIDSLNIAITPFNPDNEHLGVTNYQNLLKNSEANKHTKGIIDSYYNLGHYYFYNDRQVDSMLYFYDQAIILIERTGVEKLKLPEIYTFKATNLMSSSMEFLSLESFEKAYELSLEGGNSYDILRAQVNLSGLNLKLKNYEKAIKITSELLENPAVLADNLAGAINKNYNVIDYVTATLYDILGASLVETNKLEEGLALLKISDSISRKNQWDQQTAETQTWIARTYLDLGDLKKAILLCESINTEFADFPGKTKLTNLILGRALVQDGQIPKGVRMLEEGLELNGTKEEMIAILETLGFAYLSQNNVQQSEPLFSKAIELRDSMQDSRAKRFSRYSSISYNLLETQFKNDNLAHKNEVLEVKAIEREYLLGVLVLSITVILLSILGYVLWKKYHTGKKTIQSLKANEKAILEAQIKLREDELSATMVHFTKNMKTIKTIVKDLDSSLAKKDYGALQMVKNSLQEYQKSSSTASLLTDRIESQYPGISMQLRELYPNFSPNDIKHCLMIKLGLSLKETAQLFNITIAAVKSARGRMKKKMGLDQDVSLKQHLSFIAK